MVFETIHDMSDDYILQLYTSSYFSHTVQPIIIPAVNGNKYF